MKNLPFFLVLVTVILLPFLFRTDITVSSQADETLIIITPHDEGIRHEFALGFADHYRKLTGKSVHIDWRVIGGTSEIIRYIQSTYTNNFRNYWESRLGRQWNAEVQNSFMNRRVMPSNSPQSDDPGQAAKRAFLESNVSCGIDILFGGGSYDFIQQARAGTLIPFTSIEGLAEMLPPERIPIEFSGEPFYDANALWVGAVLSQFGIIYNTISLQRLGIEHPPNRWVDLTDPRYLGELAVSDPSLSGSSTKAFEMIVQQQMLERVEALGDDPGANLVQAEVAQGWLDAMQLIQILSANARYFTDSSKKPSIDVSAGECAAGMSIDFYGRFQAETLLNRTGSDRFGYVTPVGGSTVSVDPVAILRGAPNRELAEHFLAFVMSDQGQKLWNWKVGTPEGPRRYALRRSPMPLNLYEPHYQSFRSDPEINPYVETGSFVYHPEWTARLFGPLRFIIKTAFIDPHKELTEAWRAILKARSEGREADATSAYLVLTNLSRIDYDHASDDIAGILNLRTKISEVQLAREITLHFRNQYRQAKRVAEGR